jgi:hypothetical protein
MKYHIGIDLGTTNTSMTAVVDGSDELLQVEIHQLISEGLMDARPILPSVLYLPTDSEFPEGVIDLPWEKNPTFILGEMAKRQWERAGYRIVHSAKSWLCHSGIRSKDAVLPWGSKVADKLSAFEMTKKILVHLKDSWNYDLLLGKFEERLEEQNIVITVPASFDPGARDLTLEAAKEVGFLTVRLLEEPQAALYAWLQTQGESWRDQLDVGGKVLVCDIGGGTTDFSLMEATDEDGVLGMRRVAVGKHILLGGDNMDLGLTHTLVSKLKDAGQEPDDQQRSSLVAQAREAKEQILSGSKDQVEVVLTGSGSSLFGSAIQTTLERKEVENLILEGFFGHCHFHDKPLEKRAGGLRHVGLEYAKDPSILKHLAQFLTYQGDDGADAKAGFPGTVLFNGSMFRSAVLRDRVCDSMSQWLREVGGNQNDAGHQVSVLEGNDYPLAVSRGAAYYAQVSQGKGIRIKAALPYSYYVGVEKSQMAVPGVEAELSLLCVAPYGMEEGSTVSLEGETFYLVHGEEVQFRLFRSPYRKDSLGATTDLGSEEFEEISCLEKSLEEVDGASLVPVYLETVATEVGSLELWCVSTEDSSNKWRLEFEVLRG